LGIATEERAINAIKMGLVGTLGFYAGQWTSKLKKEFKKQIGYPF